MSQQQNGHPTTEQLSALLDQQLSLQEQQLFETHIPTCQQCQYRLTELRQTVALLRALPQPALPRSFVLPVLSENPAQQTSNIIPLRRRQPGAWQTTLRRSAQVISTLVAVLGLFLLLSGVLRPIGQSTNATTASSAQPQMGTVDKNATSNPQAANTPSINTACNRTQVSQNSENCTGTTPTTPAQANTQTATANNTPTAPASQPTTTTGNTQGGLTFVQVEQQLDLTTPQGRLTTGAALFVLGLLGLFFAYRKRNAGDAI